LDDDALDEAAWLKQYEPAPGAPEAGRQLQSAGQSLVLEQAMLPSGYFALQPASMSASASASVPQVPRRSRG
jgi:hypothetical protein